MYIIKRSGKKEEYSAEKIRHSLAASSDEAKEPLNESDLHRLINELEHILRGKENVTSQQIIIILAGLLYTKGYYGTLEHYLSYSRRRV